MVNVTNRPYVAVRLCPFKFFFRHFRFLCSAGRPAVSQISISSTDTACETSPAAPDQPLRSSRGKTPASAPDPKPAATDTTIAPFQPCSPAHRVDHVRRQNRIQIANSDLAARRAPSNTSQPGRPRTPARCAAFKSPNSRSFSTLIVACSKYSHSTYIQQRSTLERETGIEPATNSLEGCDSTTELLPPKPAVSSQLSALSSTSAAECNPQLHLL